MTKLKKLTLRSWGVSMDYRIYKLNELLRGWFNYFKLGIHKSMCKIIDGNIRFRLRMCIWKQWKMPITRYRNLIKLGFEKWKARTWANCRKSYARCASSFLQVAIPNKLFETKGLVSLLSLYQYKTCFV